MKGCIFLVIFYSSFLGTESLLENRPGFRLRNDLVANAYNIKIQPDISNGTFHGEVHIFVELEKPLRYISLNMKDLKVESLILDTNTYQTKYEIQKDNELIHIFYDDFSYIDPGEHTIHMRYTGIMRSDSTGFFKSAIESRGKILFSAATMFSAPYARTVFPCLDEPAFKSRFKIRLVKPEEGYTALSNMETIGSYEVENGTLIDFQTTPPISPYIVCFVFTQYNYKSAEYKSKDGRVIPLRFFLLDEYLDQAPIFLDIAKHALEFFEEYTNITYPISKLDFIEVPEFSFEGMENIGLVILTHLKVTYNASSPYSKLEHFINAAQLVVHEIAHMWFGNIVTAKWYNDLWLNEGFAQFMQIKGLDQYPGWKLDGIDTMIIREEIFYKDTRPIVKFSVNNDQVEDQFGDITYTKGSAVVRMLEMVMGEKQFQTGIRRFQKKFYMSSATTGDFINVIQSVDPKLNIRGFLESWLYQDSFPVLTVSKDNVTNGYILHQKSFVKKSNTSSIFGGKWTIPVTFTSSCNKSMKLIWFDRDTDKLKLSTCDGNWIKFNYKGMGSYIVQYMKDQYEQLIKNFDELDEYDQANLIQESLHLVLHQQIQCDIPLKFMGKLKNNMRALPTLVSLNVFPRMLLVFARNKSTFEKMREYFVDIFKGVYEKAKMKTGFKDDLHLISLARFKVLQVLCMPPISYEKCLEDAKNFKGEDSQINPEVTAFWKRLMKDKTGTRVSIDADDISLVNNPTEESSFELYVEKCMAWIKMNL